MKALTICQPYAHLIAIGEKPIENRRWPTQYRGRIAIHAGKSRAWMDVYDEQAFPTLVFGAVVATAELYACVRRDRLPPELIGRTHAHGPWYWLLRDVQRLESPVPFQGLQGLWEFPDELLLTQVGGQS